MCDPVSVVRLATMGRRLLVAGEKSQVGKSTISLGVLGALLEAGYQASELAYIKPATQCVKSTVVARFCESHGITYVHIGPVVFYSGFTRECLDAAASSATPALANTNADADPHVAAATAAVADAMAGGAELVRKCAAAVEEISSGKKLTLIDGVGYPSVGSIVGCSSADIAVACAAPVLLVGKPGVGDAIDSFNLCARFFEAQGVPVVGAIFNKCPPTGFYSREVCDRYIRQYFAGHRPMQRVYGVLPAVEGGIQTDVEEACASRFRHSEVKPSAGALTEGDATSVASVGELFREHVDLRSLLSDLEDASDDPESYARSFARFPKSSAASS